MKVYCWKRDCTNWAPVKNCFFGTCGREEITIGTHTGDGPSPADETICLYAGSEEERLRWKQAKERYLVWERQAAIDRLAVTE